VPDPARDDVPDGPAPKHPDPPRTPTPSPPDAQPTPVDRLDGVLSRGELWGLELEPRFRVLAVTLELAPGDGPWQLGDDRRIQLLCHPVSTILGALHRFDTDDAPQLVTFEADQLVEVATAFGGVTLTPPVFGRPEPRPGQWGPRFSLEGRSSAPDGRSRTVTIEVADADARLRVFVRCDTVEVRDANGAALT
jgi:hypothetical protein